jgi:hypothetical protein
MFLNEKVLDVKHIADVLGKGNALYQATYKGREVRLYVPAYSQLFIPRETNVVETALVGISYTEKIDGAVDLLVEDFGLILAYYSNSLLRQQQGRDIRAFAEHLVSGSGGKILTLWEDHKSNPDIGLSIINSDAYLCVFCPVPVGFSEDEYSDIVHPVGGVLDEKAKRFVGSLKNFLREVTLKYVNHLDFCLPEAVSEFARFVLKGRSK